MLKGSFLFVPVLLLLSCSNSGSAKPKADSDSSGIATTVKNSLVAAAVDNLPGVSSGTPDFLALSMDADETSRGFLQGVAKTDSAGPYVSTEYYSDSLSFQLIYFPVKKAKADVSLQEVLKADSTNYEGFELFAFVYPMKDRTKMEDFHDDNVVYPAPVKAYVRRGKTWRLLGQSKAKDLTELNTFIIRSMYGVK